MHFELKPDGMPEQRSEFATFSGGVTSLPDALQAKCDLLLSWLRERAPVVVCLSGGVDSVVLAQAARIAAGDSATAVTAVSPSVPQSDLDDAVSVASRIGIAHRIIETGEFERTEYTRNPTDRCYFCKDTLYGTVAAMPQYASCVVVNGANLDDRGDHRPGMRAANEHRVLSPFIEVGLTKDDIRELARYWQLPVADKPASPCLSSRIRYGVEVTPARTRRIEQAERWLQAETGVRELRVRLEPHETARIEVPSAAIAQIASSPFRTQLVEFFRQLGFRYVCVDLEGFRSGSLNEIVPLEQLERSSDQHAQSD